MRRGCKGRVARDFVAWGKDVLLLWKNAEMSLWQGVSRYNHSRRRCRIGSVEKSDEEGPAGWPSAVAGVKFSKDIASVATAFFCDGQNAHDDGNHTSKCPVDGKCLISRIRGARGKSRVSFLTSSSGSHLLPREEVRLHRMVMPKKMSQSW